jgi:hypothetical protein
MELKKDLVFWKTQKIPGNPPYKNAGKYCNFHKQAGHYTEEFIKNDKLVWFLVEQRN